jgi:hypothetical protein
MRRRLRTRKVWTVVVGTVAVLGLGVAGLRLLTTADGPGAQAAVQQRPSRAGRPQGDAPSRAARQPRIHPGRTAGATAASAGEFAVSPGKATWTFSVGENGNLLILHHGVRVVRGLWNFWDKGSHWAGQRFTVTDRSSQGLTIQGKMQSLGLNLKGTARPVSDRELRLDLEFDAAKSLAGMTGGGISWMLTRDSPAFRGKVDDPELLEDGTGWSWEPRPGQGIEVRFDEPLAQNFFVFNRKDQVRSMIVDGSMRQGRKHVGLTIRLPEGGRLLASEEERFARLGQDWFRGALRWNTAPVDLSFLNAGERPAGKHGEIKAQGDGLVFEDGTPVRFWGANLAGPVLFSTPAENIPAQAHRLSQFGYNLIRIIQHDAHWTNPNIFGKRPIATTRRLDEHSLDQIDRWVKALKDEGIYVWLDMHYLRKLEPGDRVSLGWGEIERAKGIMWGFNYLNPQVVDLMKEQQHQFLTHVNRYTRLAYKDDPAIVGVLITNENDLTFHFGNMFLKDKHNPVHQSLFDREVKSFARSSGLPANKLGVTWQAGIGKYFLNELEHRFNRTMIDALRGDGVRAPIATTSLWGPNWLYSLPALTDGDMVDAHAYGEAGELEADPHYRANFLSLAAAAHVEGKPLTISEWNVPFPTLDRFTAPLFVASIACLQGWDAPMLYNYSQLPLMEPGQAAWRLRIDKWSTFNDPAISAVMPAAAIAFRRGHISPARRAYCLTLPPERLLGEPLSAASTVALRTLLEQSRFTVAMPATKELPWLRPSESSGEVIRLTDPDQDFIPPGEPVVRSDTGELSRNWEEGFHTIDTPRTQAAGGWIGGKTLNLKDATFEFKTRCAVVSLTSIDDLPLSSSRFILVTTIGQARPSPVQPPSKTPLPPEQKFLPYYTEPVVGTIRLRNSTEGLALMALGADGKVVSRSTPARHDGALSLSLPDGRGTHWYVLKATKSGPEGQPPAPREQAGP